MIRHDIGYFVRIERKFLSSDDCHICYQHRWRIQNKTINDWQVTTDELSR